VSTGPGRDGGRGVAAGRRRRRSVNGCRAWRSLDRVARRHADRDSLAGRRSILLLTALAALGAAACGGAPEAGDTVDAAPPAPNAQPETPGSILPEPTEAPPITVVETTLEGEPPPSPDPGADETKLPELGSNPFIGGRELAAGPDGKIVGLDFTAVTPAEFGQPDAIFGKAVAEDQTSVGVYYEDSEYGPFEILQHVSGLSPEDLEAQVDQFEASCAVAEPAEECATGTYELVTLADGSTAMMSAIFDGAGGFSSGGLMWLDGGVLFVLQIRAPGTFTREWAQAIAKAFIDDVGDRDLVPGGPPPQPVAPPASTPTDAPVEPPAP
jgi:hypothetical protein